MTKIHKIKKVPPAVSKWFSVKFQPAEKFTFDFYWYAGMDSKTYGCFVYKNGKFYHNATQASLEWFTNN